MTRLVVGISGASGAVYAVRLLQVLHALPGIDTHLVMSGAARRTMTLETDFSVEEVRSLATHVHPFNDIAAPIASGSFQTSGMVVIPCSMKTLSGIASSYSANLLLRAADVTLKDRRRLVLVPRETPLHLGHLELMVRATQIGAIVFPPVPAFYHRPTQISEIVDQTVGRVLGLLGVEPPKELAPAWMGPKVGPE